MFSAEAMIGWFMRMRFHGLMKSSVIMGPLLMLYFAFKQWRMSLRDCSLLLSSTICVLRTEFSACTAKNRCVVRVKDVKIWLFSFLSWPICAVRPSKCFCLRILDRLADSRTRRTLIRV
ncbi:unnamed protein product [Musa acuminata var. zebrina]